MVGSGGRARARRGRGRPALAAVVLLAGCASGAPSAAPAGTSAPGSVTASTPARSSAAPTTRAPVPTRPPASTSRPPVTTHQPASTGVASTPAGAAVIVLDPGHSVAITSTDPATGLIDSDYENEPEMRDVFAVALLVRGRLQADGYRVVMTKNSLDQRISLGQRAAVANSVHAALAVSIHDQAGPNGGIGFDAGNDTVYYQSVGGYRETPNGTRVTFTDAAVAALSQRYGAIFQARRSSVEGQSVRLQGDVGYDLGGRGLAAGDMWMVQLLSKVPWIYNESGGNSVGMSGLDAADEQRYAAGLVAGIEACVPAR